MIARELAVHRHRSNHWTPAFAFLAAALMVMLGSPVVAPAANSENVSGRYIFAELADQVLPSVVTVYVKKNVLSAMSEEERQRLERFREFFENSPFGDMLPEMPENLDPEDEDAEQWMRKAAGSGVIVSEDGYIITNWHVAGGKEDDVELTVVLYDDTKISGDQVEVVYSDSLLDLALLKIDRDGLTPIEWGNSETLRIGERVAAIGSPLDLRRTITQGIVCAKGRNVGPGLGRLIQTDAVINPGSSGGPLVNLLGELVGINRLITTRTGWWQGYGFALPGNDVKHFYEVVREQGEYTHGYIGVYMASEVEDTPKMREALGIDPDRKGVLVTRVTPDSPAEKAGLQAGDFIVRAGDAPIQNPEDLLNYVTRQSVGDSITLKILRSQEDAEQAKPLEVEVKIVERPSGEELAALQRGESFESLRAPHQALARDFGMTLQPFERETLKGLRVTQMRRGSPAAEAGLRPGDVIVRFDRKPVSSLEDLQEAVEHHPEGRPHLVQYVRDGRASITAIEAE